MNLKHILSLFLLLLLLESISSQEKIDFKKEISAVSIDTEENIYLGFADGSVEKFSSSGEKHPNFSLPNQSTVSLIEAINSRKIFLFYADIQQISILDRFKAVPKDYRLSDFGSYLSPIACPAPDGSFWLVENNPTRLRKVDPVRKQLIHEVQIQLPDSINFARTLQNLVLIADSRGLEILDQFGNHLNSINLDNPRYIQFEKQLVLVTVKNGIAIIDPYEGSLVNYKDQLPDNQLAILSLEDQWACISRNSLSFIQKD